jgi:hypothetical protein
MLNAAALFFVRGGENTSQLSIFLSPVESDRDSRKGGGAGKFFYL